MRKLTGSHEVPIGVIGSKLLVDTSLDKVSPLGDNELVVVLEDLSVCGNEFLSLDVADGDALGSVLLSHDSIIKLQIQFRSE